MNSFVHDLEDQNLIDLLRYYFDLGGKRIRPTLFYAVSKAFNSQENLGPFSLVLELIHTMSLYHDDVIDAADERRGAPTVHKKWDTATAIVGGDIFHGLIHNYLLECINGNRLENDKNSISFLSKLITQVELPIGNAVLNEMRLATQKEMPNLDEVLMVTKGKTAPLFAFSAAAAAQLAGQDQNTCDTLYSLGMSLGLAFQLLDDTSDYFESEKGMGKDLRDDRKTPILVMANQADPDKLLEYRVIGRNLSDDQIIQFRIDFSSQFTQVLKMVDDELRSVTRELGIVPENEYKETITTIIDMMLIRCNDMINSISNLH